MSVLKPILWVRFLAIFAWSLVLLGCDSLSVFTSPPLPQSLDKISSVEINEAGLLEINWVTKPNAPASIYQIYLEEVDKNDAALQFTSAALNAAPLKSEDTTIGTAISPRKKGNLIHASADLKYVFADILKTDSRYLLQLVEKGRKVPAGPEKVILLEVSFAGFAATSAVASSDSVKLNWAAVDGANRYEVYADEGLSTLLGSTPTTSITLPTKNGGLLKEYFVRAYRGQLASPDSVRIPLNQSFVVINKVTSLTPNGKYTAGKILDFEVEFSEKVSFYGTSTLPLVMANQKRNAFYVSGNNSNTLHYRYVVQAGDDTIALQNGTILGGDFVDATSLNVAANLPETGGNVSLAETSSLVIDTIPPTVPSSIGFNTAISSTGNFDVSWATSTDLYFLTHNLKLCADIGCSTACTGTTAEAGLTKSLTMVAEGVYHACVQGEDTTGLTSAWASSISTIVVDASPPLVTKVYSLTANGLYKEGQAVEIAVEFSEPVFVALPVQLALKLETGAIDRDAVYTSGSGTNVLKFTYTPLVGDANSDLNYQSTTALSAGSGSIRDAANNLALLTLPATAGAFSLATLSNLNIDTSAPTSPGTISFAGSTSSTASFAMNWTNSVDQNFKQHNVKLCLINNCSTGCTSVSTSLASPATMTGVDGTTYYGCVQGEDVLGHVTPWIASNATVNVDTSFPTVVAVTSGSANGLYDAGAVISILVQFSEAVNVTGGGSIRLGLETGSTDFSAPYVSGSGSNTLTFNYTVQAGNLTADLNYLSTTALALNGGTISDLNGNTADINLPLLAGPNSLGSRQDIAVDTINPTPPSVVAFAAPYSKTLSFSATWLASTDDNFATHNVKLCSTNDCVTGCLSPVTTAGTTTSLTGTNGSTYFACVQGEDQLGHTSAWIPSGSSIAVDTSAPTVTSVTATDADAVYKLGDVITLNVVYSEIVNVTDGNLFGLKLETGATDRTATYTTGTGTNTLVFNYTVQAGDTSSDLDYVSTASLTRNGGLIRDAAGNDAINTLPAVGGANSISGQKDIKVDTTAPSNPSNVSFGGAISNSASFSMS